jgi:hypothetical protein
VFAGGRRLHRHLAETKAARARIDGLDSVINVDQPNTLIDKDWDSKG